MGKKARETEIETNEENIEKFRESGKEYVHERYIFLDSPLDQIFPGDGNMRRSFEGILPEEYPDLRTFIEDVLKERKGQAYGVEFGGIGVKSFDSFSKGFFKKTVGVTLVEHRDEYTMRQDGESHPAHTVIVGDILKLETYGKVKETLGTEKVDLIIERMALGLELIPVEPNKLAEVLKVWYELLNEGGMMLVQTTSNLSRVLDEWSRILQDKYKDVIDFKYESRVSMGAFRLRKLPGAPKELPLLSPWTLRKIKKSG